MGSFAPLSKTNRIYAVVYKDEYGTTRIRYYSRLDNAKRRLAEEKVHDKNVKMRKR